MAIESIANKASIVGVGCCKFGENWDQSPSDMIVDAAYEAYADAGIEKPQQEIEAVFTGSLYTTVGPHECSDALKLFDVPVTMVSNYCATGTEALRCAVMSVAAGLYDTVLVVGYDKPKDRGVSGPSVMLDGVISRNTARGARTSRGSRSRIITTEPSPPTPSSSGRSPPRRRSPAA